MVEENRKKRERLNGSARVYTGESYTQSGRRDVKRETRGTERNAEQGESVESAKSKNSAAAATKRRKAAAKTSNADNRKAAAKTSNADNRKVAVKENNADNQKAAAQTNNADNRKTAAQTNNADNRKGAVKKPRNFREELRRHRMGKVRRVFYVLGGLIAVAYVGAAVYFSSHFYEGTQILGIDCSQMTVEEVKQAVAQKLGRYELEILEREDKTETISAQEIGLNFVDDGSIDGLMKAQQAYIWPVKAILPKKQTDSVAFSYDREAAAQRINALECMDSLRAVAPKDAYIGATEYGFEVVSEVMGTTLNKDKTKELLFACLDAGLDSVSLDEEECYVNPKLYHDNEELVQDAASMSEAASANITLDFGSGQEVVDAALMRDWLVETSDGVFAIDDALVEQYVESLAAKYDTFGLPVDFQTSLGTVETLSGGDYGWCLDQEKTLAALRSAIDEGYHGTLEPIYLYSAMSHENNGIGYTYVEICISQQRMWCYENGNVIVDTPVVTGNPNRGDGTPTGGVWAIDAKKRDAILTGEGYTSPVDYWMPFNGDIGIHDLKQRANFGGTIYLSNGSHGCVNTPYEQVQMIYNTVEIGTPVIVYE